MERLSQHYSFDTICEIIQQFASCMDDYPFVYDLQEDRYFLSELASERFALEQTLFSDVETRLMELVYPDDWETLAKDLRALQKGEKQDHNLSYRWMGKDHRPIWINCRGRVLKDENGRPKYLLGCINEIGIKPIADNVSGMLESRAIQDVLTGYYDNWENGYILRFGIDDFKDINEKFGMEYGDYVLHGVANCILDSLLPGQRAYRVVADEFLVMDFMYGSIEDAQELYRRVRTAVDKFIESNQYEAVYTISGGVLTCMDVIEPTYSEIMKISQFALSEAKGRGKNQLYIFHTEDYQKFLRKRALLRELRLSIAGGFEGFRLFFQPIVSASKGEIYASEALLRFQMRNGESVSPMEFIPILEESGLIIPIGKWILEKAIDMCITCQAKLPDFRVSINLSYIQILKSPIIDEIYQHVIDSGLHPYSLIVELTESGYLENTPSVKRVWDNLKKFGVSIAIDDFGTGYSNLQSIGNMMPNIVKLDRGFTVKALQNRYENQLMSHIIEMVHSLDLKICVEGIETKEELEKIRELSPDYIQGFYFGRPCAKEEFVEKFLGMNL